MDQGLTVPQVRKIRDALKEVVAILDSVLEPQDRAREAKAKALPSAEGDRLAVLLAQSIQAHSPQYPCPAPRVEAWGKAFDLWLRTGIEPAKVERILRWSTADSFWRRNVLSPQSLRRHYDRLVLAAEERRPAGSPSASAPVVFASAQGWLRVHHAAARRYTDRCASLGESPTEDGVRAFVLEAGAPDPEPHTKAILAWATRP